MRLKICEKKMYQGLINMILIELESPVRKYNYE